MKHKFHECIHDLFCKRFLLLMLVLIHLAFGNSLYGQNITVTGVVTGDDGEAIPGATISILGTTRGATTNLNGEYVIEDVPGDARLSFSFIGMLPEDVSVENRTMINIQLIQDLIGLDEVVVIGYGSMKKADLTGSVSTLEGDDIITKAVPNITSTLAGKMTGVISRQNSGRPGGDEPDFTIRGQSTFGNNDALVLVDGIQREFHRIDPNDIESITILKDAASAAIYGARGANGVILVTTKRGKKSRAQINYSSSYTISVPTFVPEYMNAGEYAEYVNEARINEGGDSLFTADDVADFKDGTRPSSDWWGEMMSEWAPMSQHNLSVTGGDERTNYFLSLGYLNQGGLYNTVNYKRYNIRSNIDTKIGKNLTARLDIAARTDYTNEGTVDENKLYQTLRTALPYVPAYVPESERVEGDEMGLNSNGAAGSPMGEAVYSGYKKNNSAFIETILGLEYNIKPVPGLKFKFDYSLDKAYYNFKEFTTPYILNFYTYENGLTNTTLSESLIRLDQRKTEATKKTIQTGFMYEQSFGKHSLSGIVLFEQYDYSWDSIYVYREDFLSDAIDQVFAGADLNKDNYGSAREEARRGYVGRIAYNYANKYLLQVNGRYDGSYEFPSDYRWGFFPAFSVGWRISEEAFMKDIGFISNLKIRGSYGQFGNDRMRIDGKDVHQPYLEGYEYSEGAVFGATPVFYGGIRNAGLANKYITWETAISSNIGLEFGFLDNKITGEFDYFQKNTKDILITSDAAVPSTLGATLPPENIGEVDNWGLEGILRYQNYYGNFYLGVEGNITYATSKVINMSEPEDVPEQRRLTGQPFDVRVGYISEGLFIDSTEIANWAVQDNNGNKSINPGDIKYRDINNDTIINEKDRIIFGQSSTPKFVFGLNFNFAYKDLSLTANFQGASAYDNYRYIESFQKEYNSLAVLGPNSFREGNEGAIYPRLEVGRSGNNNTYSSFWMQKGFYIKLRNIDLSYNLHDKAFLDRLGIQNLILSISGRNILAFSKEKDFDPENPNMYYPIMKTYTFGLSITF